MAQTNNKTWGAFFSIVAAGGTSAVDAFAKWLASDLHGMVIVWGYTVGLFVFLLPYLMFKTATTLPLRTLVVTSRWRLQLARAACLVGSVGTLFYSFTYVPLVDATAVMFTSPLFVNLLAVPFLGERVSLNRWVGVVCGLIGVLIIMRPGGGEFHWAILFSVLAALFFAFFQIISRKLAATENTMTTLFYTAGGAALWSTCLIGFFWQPLTPEHALIFLGLGALGVAAHFGYIKAAQAAEASFLAPFVYTKLIFTAILGYLLFSHVPTMGLWLGSAFIIGGGLYVFINERPATAKS